MKDEERPVDRDQCDEREAVTPPKIHCADEQQRPQPSQFK
jgi:hypothetical protein